MTKNNILYSNNANTLLSANITSSSSTIPVVSTATFPTIVTAGDFFYITLDDGTNIEIVKVGGKTANTFTGCVRSQEGTAAFAFLNTSRVSNRLTAGNITNLARKEDRLATVSSVDTLPAASSANGNSALCTSMDRFNRPIPAYITGGNKWTFPTYKSTVHVGTVGVGASTTTLNLASASVLLPLGGVTNYYIIQFTSGAYSGMCRFVSSGASTLTWSTPLAGAPSSSDTYEVYRINNEVSKYGDTMFGPLLLAGNAASPLGAVPLQQLAGLVPKSGAVMTGFLSLVGNAVSSLDAVPLQQLNTRLAGIEGGFDAAAVTGTTGHFTTIGGLTIQWGQVVVGDSPTGFQGIAVTFPVAFTLLPLPPMLTLKETNTLTNLILGHYNLTTNGFTLTYEETSASVQNAVISYIAIGYRNTSVVFTALTLTPTALTVNITQGTSYGATNLTAAAVFDTLSYSVVSGSVAPGMALSTSGAYLRTSGTPSTTGTYNSVIRMVNSSTLQASNFNLQYIIDAAAPPPPPPPPPGEGPDADAGSDF